MSRKFKTPDYEATLNQTIRLREALPLNHLARFVVDVIAQLDLSAIYARYASVGGEAIAPEILLGLLFYAYATGLFSSRKIERATYESIPVRFVAGGVHPDHDTIAHFRKTFLAEIQELFVQILLLAQAAQVLKLGNLSLDGSKIHADASKSHAVSYKRLLALEVQIRQEVSELLTLGERADQGELQLPDELIIPDELALRQERLTNLARAKAVLEARAQERYAAEQVDYEAKLREREEKARATRRKPGGRPPQPPEPGPRDTDQYNFTDPESRIMKNSTNDGFDQHYNVQTAVDQASLLIVATALSNHPNDKREAEPTLDALSSKVGQPTAAALDNGYFSEANVEALERRGIEPYIATGREPHHQSWQIWGTERPAPPAEDASPKIKMAYKLQTKIGQAIYRLRKCTVEPVIGLIKEVLGFRQFSLRGLLAAAGEWCLVCLAFNLKRMHTLMMGSV
ncbi:MAG TPA: IS1182 family transposase [Anaerolineae bacterium]|nr:IS1182 family transposase [Anaerolineae bacterium]